jgi:D-alanine-D-alanine ligase
MKKINMKIEIVSSSIEELSSMNYESRNTISKVLSKYYTDVNVTLVDTLSDLELLVERNPDLVFLGMKFVPEEEANNENDSKIWISDYLDKNNITYTGSTQSAHRLEFYKELAKISVHNAGLKTADFKVIRHGRAITKNNLMDFPLFVKPTDQGGGTGIDNKSLVYNLSELNRKTASIYSELGSDSLVETYLDGREFSVAILKNKESVSYSIMPLELIAPINSDGARFLSSIIKKADTEKFRKVIEQNIFDEITALAMDVFIAIGARDYGRIDIRFNSSGTPHFMEANLIPSLLKDYGNFPKACKLNLNLEYEEIILQIVSLALSRNSLFALDETPNELSIKPILAII